MRKHQFYYKPALLPTEQRYWIGLPVEAAPRRWQTMTTGMRAWIGQIEKVSYGDATAFLRHGGELVTIQGRLVSELREGDPCYIMEHLCINGRMEYMVGMSNILNGNMNFVNFGIPNGKHIRIDIYTGESRIING